MELIGLEDLPDNFRVGLEQNFRKRLFSLARKKIGKAKTLGKILNMHTDTILRQEKGIRFIKISTLKKLSEITNIPIEDIERQITELRTRNIKHRIHVKFPVFVSKELASLIGHCIGDGNLSKKQFSFFNLRRELIDEVINDVRIAFSTDIKPKEFKKDDGCEIEFPTNIARLIFLTGGPLGKKVFTEFRVPEWIMDGTDEIKIEFIRALFDDEGCVFFKRNKRAKNFQRLISFNMAKNESFLENHQLFLEDIRKILLDLGIEATKPRKFGKTVNGISMGFEIFNFRNLTKFDEKISFSNLEKRDKLIACLESFKRIQYYEILQIP